MREWVFCNSEFETDDQEDVEIIYSVPDTTYPNAEVAMENFAREYTNDFLLFFRESSGKLCSVSAESRPEDFN